MGTKLASVGITDGTGAVLVNENLSVYVMIRVVGKKTDSLYVDLRRHHWLLRTPTLFHYLSVTSRDL